MKNRKSLNELFGKTLKEKTHNLKTMSKKEKQYEVDGYMDRDFASEEEKSLATPNLHLNDPDHPVPVTRRQFLAQGLIGTSVAVFSPGILNVLSNAAYAADCADAGAAAQLLPFMGIDCAGGYASAGANFIVGTNNSPMNFLTADNAYESMGLPAAQHPKNVGVISPFGLPMHPESRVAQGVQATASAAALANTSAFIIPVTSNDDSGNNPFNVNAVLAQGGLVGQLGAVIGTENSASGGNSAPLVTIPAFRAARVRSPGDANSLVSAGPLSQVLNQNQSRRVIASIMGLANSQMAKLSLDNITQKTKDVVICGAEKNTEILGGAAVDVLGDPNITGLFPNVNQGFSGNNSDPAVATAVKLLTGGQVGSATIEVGGCDYHGNGSPNQQTKDLQIGRNIGRAIEYAHRVQKPIVLQIFSDGGIDFNGRRVGQNAVIYEPSGDQGTNGMIVMIVYNPAGRLQVVKPQLGSYNNRGVVANSTAWSNSTQTAARVVVANYLFLAGKLSKFNELFPNPGFNVNDVIAFGASVFPQG